MTDRERDEQLLIDYVLGRCEPAEAEEVVARLTSEPAFAAMHADISNAMAALGACDVPDPPADLAERALARVEVMRRTEALIAAPPPAAPIRAPLVSYRELAALAAVFVAAMCIIFPSLRRARHETRRALCGANIGMIHTALNHYASGNARALPESPPVAENWLKRPGRTYASNTAGLFVLIRKNYAPPDVFQCPAAGGGSFTVRSDLVDFPASRNIGYSYQFSIGRALRQSDPVLVKVAGQLPILADANPIFAGGQFRPERLGQAVSENHGRTGQNVLYMTGQVRWMTHARVGVAGDNIWLLKGVQDYTGNERPTSKTDTFLLGHTGP